MIIAETIQNPERLPKQVWNFFALILGLTPGAKLCRRFAAHCSICQSSRTVN